MSDGMSPGWHPHANREKNGSRAFVGRGTQFWSAIARMERILVTTKFISDFFSFRFFD
jgi:hypothetical protein